MTRSIVLLVLLMLGGCAYGHALPVGDFVNVINPAVRIRTQVDANGTFYPSGWTSPAVLGRTRLGDGHSILNGVARDEDATLRNAVLANEAAWLQSLHAAFAGKRRVFILIHGFNLTEPGATASFAAIQDSIVLTPDDALVEFFWDGLSDEGSMLGGGRIWFWAAGYSQVAGSRGLRRILDQIEGADVYLLSHSRGASVALSALGNPAYDPDFSNATEAVMCATGLARFPPGAPCQSGFLRPPALRENGNRIHLIMLAPAIGYADFRAPEKVGGEWVNRTFSNQLIDIRHTVNAGDPVLKKYVRGLSDGFNSTDLGSRPFATEALRRIYPITPYTVTDHNSHDFTGYVQCDVFLDMLSAAGVRTRDRPRHAPQQRC